MHAQINLLRQEASVCGIYQNNKNERLREQTIKINIICTFDVIVFQKDTPLVI